MIEASTIGILGVVSFFILAPLRIPVAVCLFIPSFIGIWMMSGPGAALTKLYTTPFNTVSSYSMGVLPLFIFMASIIIESGMGRDLFRMVNKLLGGLRGGLAMATIGACGIFAAVTAYPWASIGAVGSIAIPEMKRYDYDMKLAIGSVAAGSELGDLIPPSALLIIYGVMSGASIGALFIAGIVPGLILIAFYLTVVTLICIRNPEAGPRGKHTTLKEKIFSFKDGGEIIALIILLLLGLFVGWFTPTEAGAVGAFGTLVICQLRRRLDWPAFKRAVLSAARMAGTIYFLLCGALYFKDFIALSTLPFTLQDYVSGLNLPGFVTMGIIIIIYIILGCFIDVMSMILLTIGIFLPLVVDAGYSPIWFGIILVRASDIGLLTPPLGMSIFFLKGLFPDTPMSDMFKGVISFLFADFVHLLMLLAFPTVALFLPKLLGFS